MLRANGCRPRARRPQSGDLCVTFRVCEDQAGGSEDAEGQRGRAAEMGGGLLLYRSHKQTQMFLLRA